MYYYGDLYTKKSTYNNMKFNTFIQNVNIPKLTVDQMESCEGSISEIEECIKGNENNI